MDEPFTGAIGPSDAGVMPMFPLSAVLFPGAPFPLHIFEPRYRQLVTDAMTSDRAFGIVLISRGSEVGGGDERCGLGTIADIEALSQLDDGQFALLARGTQRMRVVRWLEDSPYPRAEIERLPEDLTGVDEACFGESLSALRTARALLSELSDSPPLPADLDLRTDTATDLIDAHWTLCMLAPFDAFDRQLLLEAACVKDRLGLLKSLCDELSSDVSKMLSQGETEEE